MGTSAFSGADDRPQIVGIGQFVTHHQQGGLPLLPGGGQDVLYAGILPHGGHGDDALVTVGAAHAVQLAPVGLHHHHAPAPGGGSDITQGVVCVALGNIDLVDGRAGAQGLHHCVAALNDAVCALLLQNG